ncbi:BnaCnng65790D [Brassica napus]|uniref:BnaCnng65790D protein n=1 Tax=Brassica napus TaxID=3708 RepID=A0A078JWL0_BRANA|nr:BnaCnng65790D [Brassica napus]
MLGFQLDIKKKYELWSLVGPEPLISFWEMLGVHVEAGPYTQEIIAEFERCEGWSRDDRKRLAYLAIFHGYIEGRKYSTSTRVSLARLVMELERFENYPWGRVAFKIWGRKGRIQFKEVILSQTRVINFVHKDIGEMFPKWEFDVEDTPAENIIKLMFVKKPWKWTMDCWEVTGTWVVKEDSPRPQKKARKEASEKATAEASEEEIKYLSERVEAVEKKVVLRIRTEKVKVLMGRTQEGRAYRRIKVQMCPQMLVPRKVKLQNRKEDARYLEKRDSDRTRKLAASQQSSYTANNTAKVIIPNKKLYPGYNPFAPIDKKKLKELAGWLKLENLSVIIIEHLSIINHVQVELGDDLPISRLHIDAWINVLRKSRYYTIILPIEQEAHSRLGQHLFQRTTCPIQPGAIHI